MKNEDFYKYIEDSSEFNNQILIQLKEVIEDYPYFHSIKLLLIKNLKSSGAINYQKELKETIIDCCDREKLFYSLNKEYSYFFSENNNSYTNDRTKILLDTFLDSLEKKQIDGKEEEVSEIESIISNDYLTYVEEVEQKGVAKEGVETINPMKHQQLLDDFLEKSSSHDDIFFLKRNDTDKKNIQPAEIDNLLDDDTFLTESLAQVYIKQKKYDQALTIIKKLSLNFPKKSIYFADQIRFLEHLIINEKNKK